MFCHLETPHIVYNPGQVPRIVYNPGIRYLPANLKILVFISFVTLVWCKHSTLSEVCQQLFQIL